MGGGRRAYLQRRHELASPQLLQPGRQFIRLKKCLMTVKNSLSPTETFLETKAGKLLNTCKSVETTEMIENTVYLHRRFRLGQDAPKENEKKQTFVKILISNKT